MKVRLQILKELIAYESILKEDGYKRRMANHCEEIYRLLGIKIA